MHEQPVLRKLRFFDNISCPVAERIARRGFYIPCGLGVNEATVQEVVTRIRTLLR
jgi:perosamine synthetase